jgi:Spy/CpxP family protein refolding chaperone
MNIVSRLIVVTGFSLCAVAAIADTPTTAPATPPAPAHEHGMMHHHMHMMMHDRPFLMVVHKLNLTEDQKKQIHDIIRKSDDQGKDAMKKHHELMAGMLNPGDANYANSVQAAKDAATAMIEQRSQDNTAIYNLLTAEQKAKIPQVIEDMKQHMMDHMNDHHDRRQEGPADHNH